MLAARRNLLFRVSIVINIAVLLYAAMHLSTNNSPSMEWVPITLDGADGERAGDTIVPSYHELRNYSTETDSYKSVSYESTSRKVTVTAATTNKTTSSTETAVEIVEDPSEEPTRVTDLDQLDQNVLSPPTLKRLQTLLGCSNRAFSRKIRQRGDFWVLYNYVKADHGPLHCYETITYTTHAGFEFLDNVGPLVERWNAPISLAIHTPGNDVMPAINSIRYLRDCSESDLIRHFVTFHIFFSCKHMPAKIPDPNIFLAQPYNCTIPPPFVSMNLSDTYMKEKSLLYPVNVARNIAREAALTHFILPSDIELYPSPNVVPNFLNMIARNKPPLNSTKPRVFPLSIFEVDAKVKVPSSKTELIAMLKNKSAIPFHKFVCPNCHNIPQGGQWMTAPETNQIDVFHIGKRQGKFVHWEPIFIGTHMDPYYDERLSWEGKQDKMTQGYVLCVKDYDFMILNNAFLTHKPGIKRYKHDAKRASIAGKQSRLIKTVIMPELKKLYGERKGCTL